MGAAFVLSFYGPSPSSHWAVFSLLSPKTVSRSHYGPLQVAHISWAHITFVMILTSRVSCSFFVPRGPKI